MCTAVVHKKFSKKPELQKQKSRLRRSTKCRVAKGKIAVDEKLLAKFIDEQIQKKGNFEKELIENNYILQYKQPI